MTTPREALATVTEDARDGVDLREVMWRLAGLAGIMSILYGVIVIAVPGIEHSPHLAAMWMLPGSPASWGLLIIAIGTATLTGTILRWRRLARGGLFWCGVWTLTVALAGGWSGISGDASALPAALVYLWLGILQIALLSAIRRMRCLG